MTAKSMAKKALVKVGDEKKAVEDSLLGLLSKYAQIEVEITHICIV